MDVTIESHNNPPATSSNQSPVRVVRWLQRLTLVSGLVSLAISFLIWPENLWILSTAFGLLAISSFLEFGFRWQAAKRASARQGWRRYAHLHETIQRLEDGLDVVSPVIPAIELDGQTLVVLRAWSAKNGKATLLLNQDGRAIKDHNLWRKSVMLIEFANACLPGVIRNRQAIIQTNLYARNLAAKAWKNALHANKDIFRHQGLAAACQILMEHWDTLESFLNLRTALFQAEDQVVRQVSVPSPGQEGIQSWISQQERIHQAMATLSPGAEKISEAAARLLTAWMENKSSQDWQEAEALEASLKFAYLFQSLLKRTLHRWDELQEPDLKPFHRGLDLARQTGLMINAGG